MNTTHLYSMSVLIGRSKTRKTLCNIRVAESALALNDTDATCPACRAARDLEIAGMETVIAGALCDTTELRKVVDLIKPVRYKNQEFFR